MSLEAAIEANTQALTQQTDAIKALLAKMVQGNAPLSSTEKADLEKSLGVKTNADIEKEKAAKTSSKAKPKSDTSTEKNKPSVKDEKPQAEKATAKDDIGANPTLEDLSTAIVGLAKAKGRDAVLSLLEPYGVEKAGQAPKDKWAEIIEKANTAAEAD